MSEKSKSIGEYFKKVITDGLPKGDDLNKTIKTPPHSGTQRTSSANKLNGVKEMKAQNEEGRVTYIVCTDNGQSLNFDEVGNIFLGCGKIGDDESGGTMTVRPQGQMIVKVGDTLSIEVENGQDQEKPLSLVVYGDINMEARGGNLQMSGDNVSIKASNDMNIEASKTLTMGNGKSCGNVHINAGTIKHDAVFIKDTISGSISQSVYGEYTIEQLLSPNASFNIISSGAFNLTAGGDLTVKGLARAEARIAGKPPIGKQTATTQNAFMLNVLTGNSKIDFKAGNVTYDVKGGNVTSTISGNNTSTVSGNQTKTISGNHTSTYSGTFNETITGATTLTNNAAYTQTITGVHTLTSNAQYTHNITGNAVIFSKAVMTITGGTQINLN